MLADQPLNRYMRKAYSIIFFIVCIPCLFNKMWKSISQYCVYLPYFLLGLNLMWVREVSWSYKKSVCQRKSSVFMAFDEFFQQPPIALYSFFSHIYFHHVHVHYHVEMKDNVSFKVKRFKSFSWVKYLIKSRHNLLWKLTLNSDNSKIYFHPLTNVRQR